MNAPVETALGVVIPCFNEAEVLPRLRARLVPSLELLTRDWEVIFVDDGSRDETFDILSRWHLEDPRLRVISLSRNFGQQAAIAVGLQYAAGDYVGVMDADLQDPPELLGQCLARLREGYDVVYAVRKKRKEGLLSRAAYALFYRGLRLLADTRIPVDAGDFCMMSRRVVQVLKQMPERNLFLRGLRAWAGFRQVGLEYERDARYAGRTKYPVLQLLSLAADGVFAFSILPLRVATLLGLAALIFSTGMGLLTLAWWLLGFRLMGHTAAELPGWTTLAGGMFFFAGVQLLILGCLGEYVGRIYTEIKQRPRWVIREMVGVEAVAQQQGQQSLGSLRRAG